MKSRTLARLEQSAARFVAPPGCPACVDWPSVWFVGAVDPEPPLVCDVSLMWRRTFESKVGNRPKGETTKAGAIPSTAARSEGTAQRYSFLNK